MHFPEHPICLFGAYLDTGNLGVSALCLATVAAIARRSWSQAVVVFDEGAGLRETTTTVDGREFHYWLCGACDTRRIYRRHSLWNIRLSGWFGGIGSIAIKVLRSARMVLDVSGGDSFSDIYGRRRFQAVALTKRITLEQRVPLVLLPQTYGPFTKPSLRNAARELVVHAHSAWARDARSFERLKELLHGEVDPARHRSGVDVAFGLRAVEPPGSALTPRLESWLQHRSAPVVGLNVSGLVFNDRSEATNRYGLRIDYRELMAAIVQRILSASDCRLLLVPHVLAPLGHFESDLAACHALAGRVAPAHRDRLEILPPAPGPAEVKWVIARLEWFCGTRMHAAIAGLSSGVPTAAVAYSDKTLGVFETCGQGGEVVDPRHGAELAPLVERLWNSFSRRTEIRRSLAQALPSVLGAAEAQMDEILRTDAVPPSHWLPVPAAPTAVGSVASRPVRATGA